MLARAIPAAVFARRRRALLERMGPGSIALLPAAPETPATAMSTTRFARTAIFIT